MSSRSRTTQHASPLSKKPVAKAIVIPPPVRDAAANDESAESKFSIFGDPLWGIAIASGILFAALAALMAVG